MTSPSYPMIAIQTLAVLPPNLFQGLLLGAALLLTAGWLCRTQLARLANFLASDFQEWLSESQFRSLFKPAYVPDFSLPIPAANPPAAYAEDEAFENFRIELKALPHRASTPLPPPNAFPGKEAQDKTVADDCKTKADALREFFQWVPEHLARLRELHQKTTRTLGPALPEQTLHNLHDQIGILKSKAALPELLPVRQMASALEGLVKQLGDRLHEVTPSTLRTVASGIDLLTDLCTPGVNPDLATNPPIRILAVDDDAVSRFAVSFAIKKAFDQPDLAADGKSAIALAAEKAYDVIFLDVQMPGMDGFELCSKIHEIAINCLAPVVFITSRKDFDARAKSIVSGGSDLIGKPFLPFEIAVKALTLVLRRRLGADVPIAQPASASPESTVTPTSPTEAAAVKHNASNASLATPSVHEPVPVQGQGVPAGQTTLKTDALVSAPGAKKASAALIRLATASLEDLRKQLQAITGLPSGQAVPQEALVTCYLQMQSLRIKLTAPEFSVAFQVASALEALLKKLHDAPKNVSDATVHTALVAVDLLTDLFTNRVKPDLATKPAISILVVDDDPLTRRAITGALQNAFLKPENADDGESALALTAKTSFDVIFMDVQMPGMDGFTACSKIHETGPNTKTPVVFVTGQIDSKSRAESLRCGGSDFVTKPFIFVELTVKALTFALRGRL
ncbi:MAG: signaling protein [Pedosphaera sp.]|nr:signaling protein [Pedosphaera sp.]